MKVAWTIFFQPGTPVIALPGWKNPRILLPTQDAVQRWKQSSFYPAFRLSARVYRFLIRLYAMTPLAHPHSVLADGWPMKNFTQDVLPDVANAVVMVRKSDPAERSTAQLWDSKGRVIGYLRYAEKEIARQRLRREHLLLLHLPEGVAPKPVKCGPLAQGEALLKAPLSGHPVTVNPPLPGELVDLLDSLTLTEPLPLDSHPWVRYMRSRTAFDIDSWFEPLTDRDWQVVIQHGDLTPWNLLRSPEGQLQVVDWEYGTLEGFPYMDLTHYILQTSALVKRLDPAEAIQNTIDCLLSYRSISPSLSKNQAYALVRLSAYEAYLKTSEDGKSPGSRLQRWREEIWSGEARC